MFSATGFRDHKNRYLIVGNFLTKEKINFKQDYHRFDEGGVQLTFDFYIPEINFFIDVGTPDARVKSRYCVQNQAHMIVLESDNVNVIEETIKEWIAYLQNPHSEKIPMKKEIERMFV